MIVTFQYISDHELGIDKAIGNWYEDINQYWHHGKELRCLDEADICTLDYIPGHKTGKTSVAIIIKGKYEPIYIVHTPYVNGRTATRYAARWALKHIKEMINL